MRLSLGEEAKMIASRKYLKTSDDTKDGYSSSQLDQVKTKKFAQKLIVIKCSGDLITST